MMEGDKGRTALGFSVMGGTQPTRLSTGTAASVTHARSRARGVQRDTAHL